LSTSTRHKHPQQGAAIAPKKCSKRQMIAGHRHRQERDWQIRLIAVAAHYQTISPSSIFSWI
jgi:hypothetical protein